MAVLEVKKETRGGTRQGSGAKPKYSEQTIYKGISNNYIDLSNLSSGAYFIRVIGINSINTYKVIKIN